MRESVDYHRAHHLFEEKLADEMFTHWKENLAWEWIEDNKERVIDHLFTVQREGMVQAVAETLIEDDHLPLDSFVEDNLRVIYDDLWVPESEEP